MNFKEIHIGSLIKQRVYELGKDTSQLCEFMKCSEQEIEEMYTNENMNTDILLKWSKVLEYDFFRLYTQHLILYAPLSSPDNRPSTKKSLLPNFRKNIYTAEIVEYMVKQVLSGEMTKKRLWSGTVYQKQLYINGLLNMEHQRGKMFNQNFSYED